MSKIIAKSKYLEFKCAKSPSDNDWFYVRRTNDTNCHDSAVVITTLVKKNDGYNFLFLKTKRPPLYAENKSKFCIESPAGLIGDIDKNEDILKCAQKELLEEGGFRADKIFIELLNSSTSSGLSSETLSYVTAIVEKDNAVQKPIDDGGIIVDRFFINKDKILDYIKNLDKKENSLASATIAGIFFALNRIDKM